METKIIEIPVLPEESEDLTRLEEKLRKKLRMNSEDQLRYKIIKKSLDARKKPIQFIFRVEIDPDISQETSSSFQLKSTAGSHTAVVVGFGPAGMFAALQLLENGIKPIVIERGKPDRERRRDLVDIFRQRVVNPESNYCFGEGGAGTFSDGKLYTRSKKRGDIKQVLQCFVEHGADEDILINAHPHIGTNRLPEIVEAIRATIEKAGGEIRFETRLTGFVIENNAVKAVQTNNGEIPTESVILATGHSARDVFKLLHEQNIAIEAKPFALGVRIEHSQKLIDRIQYSCKDRGDFLPPAAYSLVRQVDGRGVFSFCMCPGGIIAPAMTDNGEIVVNGWSPSKRSGKFANSGFVVQVQPKDWEHKGNDALAALRFQSEIEHRAWVAGGEDLSAPAQRASDFVRDRISSSIPETSYIPGVHSANLGNVLPKFISDRIKGALIFFNKRMNGFAGPEAVLVGVESRTSSPVRIPRDRETLEHPDIKGLYPCGEGAGYAGGIMSAALDGIACARAVESQERNSSLR